MSAPLPRLLLQPRTSPDAAGPPDALLSAAFDALHRAGKLSEPTLADAMRDRLHAGVLRAYAAALRHGQRPYPPPAHVRPSVVAPLPPAMLPPDRAGQLVPRARLAAVDLKRRAAGDVD